MELVVFDLDGTLLNRESSISSYTAETLKLLTANNIAYTLATGRTFHGARAIVEGHGFSLPQAYKNGVLIWHPEQQQYASSTTLTASEVNHVIESFIQNQVTPFVFTLNQENHTTVYHTPLKTEADRELVRILDIDGYVAMRPLDELPQDATVTHVNSIGAPDSVKTIVEHVEGEPHLVAYSGVASEGSTWHWLDIHHFNASKGDAIKALKSELGLEKIICFGDSDNDLSMFQIADEAYAPENANETIKSVATDVIGHHDEDAVARFLRKRYVLDSI